MERLEAASKVDFLRGRQDVAWAESDLSHPPSVSLLPMLTLQVCASAQRSANVSSLEPASAKLCALGVRMILGTDSIGIGYSTARSLSEQSPGNLPMLYKSWQESS